MSVLSESEMAKYSQLQRVPKDADACAVVVIAAWWTKMRRTSGDLKDLDKLGIDLDTSLAAIALAPLPVDSVVTVIRAPMETLNKLDVDAAVDFILPLSPTSPSKAGSCNPPQPRSPLLVQLRTVSNMTAYGELGDDTMGKQGGRASAGVLVGGGGRRGGWQISSVSVVLSKFFFNSEDLDPTQFHRMGTTVTAAGCLGSDHITLH